MNKRPIQLQTMNNNTYYHSRKEQNSIKTMYKYWDYSFQKITLAALLTLHKTNETA